MNSLIVTGLSYEQILQNTDDLRTNALRPLRRQLLSENRFVGKPIEISGDGTDIHVTIAGKFGMSITKTDVYFEDEDEIHLPEFYETLLFEVGDGGKLDLKQNTMKYFNDNETEKIARYILGYMSAYDMHEGDVSFIWDPFPGSKEDKID